MPSYNYNFSISYLAMFIVFLLISFMIFAIVYLSNPKWLQTKDVNGDPSGTQDLSKAIIFSLLIGLSITILLIILTISIGYYYINNQV
jgi:ABC-type Fe3+ transport system permease subunit